MKGTGGQNYRKHDANREKMRWRMVFYDAVKAKNVSNALLMSQLKRGVRWKQRGQKLSLLSVTFLLDTQANMPRVRTNKCTHLFVPSAIKMLNRVDRL